MSCWHVRMRVTAASRARRQVDEREDRAGWVRAARSEAQLGRQARPLARRGPRRAPDAGLRGVPACRRGVPCRPSVMLSYRSPSLLYWRRLYYYSKAWVLKTSRQVTTWRLQCPVRCTDYYEYSYNMIQYTPVVFPRAGTEDAQRIWCWRGVLCLLLWKIMKWRRILRLRY